MKKIAKLARLLWETAQGWTREWEFWDYVIAWMLIVMLMMCVVQTWEVFTQ